jgi:TrmH family RNA methyltransferase
VTDLAAARRDPSLAVLEGFHAVKHAMRFGAELVILVRAEDADVEGLGRELAPDLVGRFADIAAVPRDVFAALVPHPPRTGMIAVARRPKFELPGPDAPGPIILLENPRDLANVGACVRVAAAAGAAALVTIGDADPWHPDAIRGAAGLQFALPVGRVEAPPAGRPLVALDPAGEPLEARPAGATLAFGSERRGLSDELLAQADARLALPMRAGVSSLNLATAVAATLYRR